MKYSVLLNILLIAVIGIYLYNHKDNNVEYTQDIKPPVPTIEKQPITNQDYIDAFNSPIEIFRNLDGNTLYIKATDTWKSTSVTDKVTLKHNRNFLFSGAGIDHDLKVLYTIGYMRTLYFDSLYIGGYAAFNQSALGSVNAVVGFSF